MSIKELHKTIHDYSLKVYEFKEHQVFLNKTQQNSDTKT